MTAGSYSICRFNFLRKGHTVFQSSFTSRAWVTGFSHILTSAWRGFGFYFSPSYRSAVTLITILTLFLDGWPSFHGLMCLSSTLFGKMSVHVFCPLSNWDKKSLATGACAFRILLSSTSEPVLSSGTAHWGQCALPWLLILPRLIWLLCLLYLLSGPVKTGFASDCWAEKILGGERGNDHELWGREPSGWLS